MLAQEVIAAKRDGQVLEPAQIANFVGGLTDESWSEGQVAALAMAILLNGFDVTERAELTRQMRDSGTVQRWDLPGPVVDKHSTGGVGDNVSLMLAPALAACGVYVPMISGRGLGHTGGTLDKFDAIPGYQTQPDTETLHRVVADVGCAIIGQTGDIAPADRRLYAIRDVTATVESIDLITASILSKKLAAGLEALVLDVKLGSGAFMRDKARAEALARSLVDVSTSLGCPCSALLTDMNEPLAAAAGNALEMANAVAFLTGDEIDSRLWDVTVALGAELLVQAGRAADIDAGRDAMVDAFQSGAAAERFQRMVEALGGPAGFIDRPWDHLARASQVREVTAGQAGFISAIDAAGLGQAVVELGGGRRRAADPIDYAVGLKDIAGLGLRVEPDTPLLLLHANDDARADAAEARVRAAITISDTPPAELPLIYERIS
ncbi:thymidine phosphorylase [Oceanomicrobium pacificus]|uniref:Thymidine phosphorylase n=1 Tax=Oceanomicrobium pacificus TaxID=2692916 RepID=A0A6B0TXA6_9RHOB|nr:thymidine phosphorylase [Oceanomicrobium pacificus]MXU66118.1 thymidine phosphorylase [Oceanomicrobium pacificus]